MNKLSLGLAAICVVAAFGCSDSDNMGAGGFGGEGGAGGSIGPLTWTTPGLTIVGDTCEFFADEALTFDITIQGSSVVMSDADPESSLEVSTDTYSPEQNEVLLTAQVENESFAPCVVELDDAFRLVLDDPDVSLAENDTVQVTWNHVETDVSAIAGDCEGEWFVDLPCAGEVTFTLTQELE